MTGASTISTPCSAASAMSLSAHSTPTVLICTQTAPRASAGSASAMTAATLGPVGEHREDDFGVRDGRRRRVRDRRAELLGP